MPIALTAQKAGTGTLADGVAQDVDIPIDGASRVGVTLANTGDTNAITTTQVFISRLGGLFVELTGYGAAVGSIAHGAAKDLGLDEGPITTLRLRLTSTGGTDFSYELGGV